VSLTLALALVGALVLVGVIVHGLWQARRANPRLAEPITPANRREPTLGEAPAPETANIGTLPAYDGAPGASAPRQDPITQVIGSLGSLTPKASDPSSDDWSMPTLLKRPVRLDASIDSIAPIALDAPITGELALVHLPSARRAGSKPFYIEGLNTQSHEWEAPEPQQRYSEFQAGVQLANRSGPLNQIEFSEFIQKVQTFADAIGGAVDAPDMLTVIGRARDLDAFAQSSDAVLTAELRTNGAAWSTGFVQQCAARHGFVAGALPGRLVLPGAAERGDPPMLTLNVDPQAALADDPNQSVVRSVTLTLDVPQTPEAGEPFAAWHRVANDLAREMDASLVDDDGKPIALQAFAAIGQQLRTLYERMAAHDLAAGSAASRRLFS
jgi:hypothetical protein